MFIFDLKWWPKIDIDTALSEKLWLSGMGNGKRARTKLQEEKGLFINNNNNNKQKQPHGEKQTGKQARLDKAGQGRTGQDRTGHKAYTAYDIRRRTNPGHCKHKEI